MKVIFVIALALIAQIPAETMAKTEVEQGKNLRYQPKYYPTTTTVETTTTAEATTEATTTSTVAPFTPLEDSELVKIPNVNNYIFFDKGVWVTGFKKLKQTVRSQFVNLEDQYELLTISGCNTHNKVLIETFDMIIEATANAEEKIIAQCMYAQYFLNYKIETASISEAFALIQAEFRYRFEQLKAFKSRTCRYLIEDGIELIEDARKRGALELMKNDKKDREFAERVQSTYLYKSRIAQSNKEITQAINSIFEKLETKLLSLFVDSFSLFMLEFESFQPKIDFTFDKTVQLINEKVDFINAYNTIGGFVIKKDQIAHEFNLLKQANKVVLEAFNDITKNTKGEVTIILGPAIKSCAELIVSTIVSRE